jgi:hypothetical protein
MNSSEKEAYRVLASISLHETSDTINEVICKIYVPKRTNEHARVILLPNDEQNKQFSNAHMLSIRAELKQPNGDINRIASNETLITSQNSTGWGDPRLSEHMVQCEPWDLQIETIFHASHVDSKPEGYFRISRNQLLSNVWEQSFSFTGDVNMSKLDPLEVTLANGLKIDFTEHCGYGHFGDGDTLMFRENVGELQIPHDLSSVLADCLEHVDDVLRLVSFIGEYSCVCVGWRSDDSERAIEFYRRRSVAPETPPSVHDAIIKYSDFADFLPAAYKAFVGVDQNAALRRALDYVVPDKHDSLEASYIMLYAAVETLVLFFRRQEKLEFIFEDDSQWDQLKCDLTAWLKSHPVLSEDNKRRSFVYEKLSELTRLSFGTAFKKFCNRYKVDLTDLWPMVGRNSLSNIRNKLVHGEVYQPKHYHALMGAREHLRWSVYRMIFGMLGWPINRTKIDPKSLARSPILKSFDEDRRQISS